jgi:hypothetical protein
LNREYKRDADKHAVKSKNTGVNRDMNDVFARAGLDLSL